MFTEDSGIIDESLSREQDRPVIRLNESSRKTVYDNRIVESQSILLGTARSSTTDMERSHSELGTGLTDRLCSNDTDRLTDIDRSVGSQIPSITHSTYSVTSFTSEYSTYQNGLNARLLDLYGFGCSDFIVHIENHLSGNRVDDLLKCIPSNDSVRE